MSNGQIHRTDDIANGLPYSRTRVRNALLELQRAGTVNQTSRGKWQRTDVTEVGDP